MKRTIGFTLGAALVLLAILACQETITGSPEPRLDPRFGEVRVSVGENWLSGQTAIPDISLETHTYRVTLTGPDPDNEVLERQIQPGESLVEYPLDPGEWTVEVVALNQDDDKLGEGSATVTVQGGTRSSVTIPVNPVSGTGSLDLTFSWPETLADDMQAEVVWEMDSDDAPDPMPAINFTVEGENGSYTATYSSDEDAWQAGSYSVQLTFFRDGNEVENNFFSSAIAVYILAGERSEGEYTIDDEQGGLSVEIESNLVFPYSSIAFSGLGSPVTVGNDVEVSLDLDPDLDPSSVRWYLNGALQEGESGGSIALGPLAPGRYWLDALVSRGGILSSHGESFVVE